MRLRNSKVPNTTKKSPVKETALVYGSVAGTRVGDIWQTRKALSDNWIHRPKSACVHSGSEGVYSLLINSKYRGVDNGMTVTYAGCSKKTGNENNGMYINSLIKNSKTKNPVRIIRGPKKNSPFAPSSGFRFDGLYVVEKSWKEKEKFHFCLRRLVQQDVAPWIKRDVPQNDKIFKSYTREQSLTKKADTLSPLARSSPKSVDENSSSNSGVSTVPACSASLNLPVKEQQPSTSNKGNEPVQVTPSSSSSNEPTTIPISSPEEQNTDGATVKSRGGMPLPKTVKEEIKSSGTVVMEILPQQNIYEVCNELFVCEEQTTEVISHDESWEEEEIEIDAQIIKDVGDSQKVTALSLAQSHQLSSYMESVTLNSDIEVEDGPKFSQLINCPRITDVEEFKIQNSIKNDAEFDDDNDDDITEVEQPQNVDNFNTSEVTEPLFHQIDESNDGSNLYLYPAFDCKNVVEAEKAVLEGNFHWYRGKRPLNDTNFYSLQKFEEIPGPSQQNVAKDIENNVNRVEETERGDPCQELCLDAEQIPTTVQENQRGNPCHDFLTDAGQMPDSTSNMALDCHIPEQCESVDCLCKSVTLCDIMSYAFNQTQTGCVCDWVKRSPWMKYCIQKILQSKDHQLILKEKGGKERVREKDQQSGELEKADKKAISRILTVDKKHWRKACKKDEGSDSDDHSQGITSKQVCKNARIDPRLTALKHLDSFWRAVYEVRSGALPRIYSMPQQMVSDNTDVMKAIEDSSSSEEVDEKVTGKPCIYNERSEILIHHRKKRNGHLTIGNEQSQTTALQDVIQPPNKRRMVQVRNIRTKINRTRIRKVRNKVHFSSKSVDESTSNDSVESMQERQNLVDEIQEGDVAILPDICDESETPIPQSMEVESPIILETVSLQTVSQEDISHKSSQQAMGDVLPASVNDIENQSITRAQFTTSSEGTSQIKQFLTDESDLSSSTDEDKDEVSRLNPFDSKNEQKHQAGNLRISKSSSPDSDTSSFERTCEALCEAIPKQGGYVHHRSPSQSLRNVPIKTCKMSLSPESSLRKAPKIYDAKVVIRKRGRPTRTLKGASVVEESPSTSTAESSNNESHVKGWELDDVVKMKQKKQIFDMVISEDNSDSEKSSFRPKSSRPKHKVRRFDEF